MWYILVPRLGAACLYDQSTGFWFLLFDREDLECYWVFGLEVPVVDEGAANDDG